MSQWFETFINFGGSLVQDRLKASYQDTPRFYEQAYGTLLDYINDVNDHWAKLVDEQHKSPEQRRRFVDECLKDGIYIQVPPFKKDSFSPEWIKEMEKKWNIKKGPVTYKAEMLDGTWADITTKTNVMIGDEYIYLLYKMPHLRCSGLGFINQYHSPVRASAIAKIQYPISQNAIKWGEDEMRNIVQGAGADVAAYLLGVYANSPDAVKQLACKLMFDKEPSKIENIDMSLKEIIENNSIIQLAKHMFSCFGVNINPDKETVREMVADLEASNSVEEVAYNSRIDMDIKEN